MIKLRWSMTLRGGHKWHILVDGYALCNPKTELYGVTGVSDEILTDHCKDRGQELKCKHCQRILKSRGVMI